MAEKNCVEMSIEEADVVWRALNLLARDAQKAVKDPTSTPESRALAESDTDRIESIAGNIMSALAYSVRIYEVDDRYPYGY